FVALCVPGGDLNGSRERKLARCNRKLTAVRSGLPGVPSSIDPRPTPADPPASVPAERAATARAPDPPTPIPPPTPTPTRTPAASGGGGGGDLPQVARRSGRGWAVRRRLSDLSGFADFAD